MAKKKQKNINNKKDKICLMITERERELYQ